MIRYTPYLLLAAFCCLLLTLASTLCLPVPGQTQQPDPPKAQPGVLMLLLDDSYPDIPGMVLIPAGSFQMGDAFEEGGPSELFRHEVTVSAFYMDRYEVTKALWDQVRTWAEGRGYDDLPEGGGKGPSHPVHTVSWFDAIKWANARSQRDGRTPVYYTDAGFTTVYKTGDVTPHPNWSANGYRLPTEAEWEKAGRGHGEALPVGRQRQHLARARQLSSPPGRSRLRRESNQRLSSRLQRRHAVHQPGGVVCAERVRALRHGGQRVGVGLGLVRRRVLRQFACHGPARPGVGLVPRLSRRRLGQPRPVLPSGLSLRRQRLGVPPGPLPRSPVAGRNRPAGTAL